MVAIPLLGDWFGGHVQHKHDAEFLENVSAALRDDTSLAAAQRGELDAFYRARPASALCAGNEAERTTLPTQYIEQNAQALQIDCEALQHGARDKPSAAQC